jgi:hypothetical protein
MRNTNQYKEIRKMMRFSVKKFGRAHTRRKANLIIASLSRREQDREWLNAYKLVCTDLIGGVFE